MGVWKRGLPPSREAPPAIGATFNRRAIQFADKEVYARSRDDAEAALAERDGVQQAGEPVGPRALDLRVAIRRDPDGAI